MKKALAALGTLTCALAFASSASAAPGCTGAGPSKRDPNSGATSPTTYCFAYKADYLMPVAGKAPLGALYPGELFRGSSWFVCQQRGGPNPPVGNALNNFWLYTLGDRRLNGSTGWGWFPANRVSGGGNYQPIPGLRQCDRKRNE